MAAIRALLSSALGGGDRPGSVRSAGLHSTSAVDDGDYLRQVKFVDNYGDRRACESRGTRPDRDRPDHLDSY